MQNHVEFLDEVDKRAFCIILHPFTSFRAQKKIMSSQIFHIWLNVEIARTELKKCNMRGASMMSKAGKKLQEPGYVLL